MNTTFLYTLNDPRTGEIRYIGKSDNPFRRFKKHLQEAQHPRIYRQRWVASLLSLGLEPTIEILDEIPIIQWPFWEREYIRVFRAIGVRLTNIAVGGECGPGWPIWASRMRGKKHSEETKKRIGSALFGGRRSLETRKKQSLAALGKVFSSEHCKNISLAKRGCRGPNLGKKFSPETCAKISASKKAAFAARKQEKCP